MKRSLTIGCVLLVGGGVSNCGGAAEMGSAPGEQPGQAGASGSGAPDAGFVGEIWNRAGAGGAYLGNPIGAGGGPIDAGGGTSGSGPQIDSAGADGVVGAGSSGWDGAVGAGAGPIAGAGGESGAGDEALGTTPRSGTGGWIGVPPK